VEDRLDIEKLQRINLLLEASRKVSRLLLRQETQGRLIQGICDTLAVIPGYEHVFIGLYDRDGKMNPKAASGTALAADHPETACIGCDLVEKSQNKAAVALALSRENYCFGLMVLSPRNGWDITPDERQILQEMADDIALGLNRMDFGEDVSKPFMDNALTYTAVVRDHRIVYENKGLAQVRQPILFDPPEFESVYEGDRERIQKAWEDLAAGRIPELKTDFQYDPGLREPDDETDGDGLHWAMISARRIFYRDGISVVANLMDITDYREVENFLRIQDKMTSLGRITAGIAHEIRNPLSGIYIYLKAMKQIYDQMGEVAKVLSIIEKIEQASNKIESIIRRVMDFSKAGRPRFVMADLNRYIDEVTKLTAVSLRKSNITLEKHLDPELPECWAEPHLIEQVILNLVTNAAEAMKEYEGEKKITLTTGVNPAGDVIRIWVMDTGPGIPEAHQARIFDPFYTTKANSSGIGLSICHRIIQDHGGALRFSGAKEQGAQFLIELPLTPPDRTA